MVASSLSVAPADINSAVRRQNAGAGAAFEEHARNLLSTRWGIAFTKRDVTLTGGVVVKFDLVSPDGHVIGDAKTYKNLPSPSAKWSVIAEYVWLLQHTTAARRFLVFGNDSLVPSRWLRRFSALCRDVEFWFIEGDEIVDLVEFWFIEGDEIVDLKAKLGALG